MKCSPFRSMTSSITLSLIIIYYFTSKYVVRAEPESVAYYCCNTQNALNVGTCIKCISPESITEFGIESNLQQALWKVPERFRQNQSEFELSFRTRNSSAGYCEKFRIRVYDTPVLLETTTRDEQKLPIILMNGTMIYESILYDPSEYCFDRLRVDSQHTELEIAVMNKGGCGKHEKWISQLFAGMSGLSCLFTILNVIIYLSLRNYLNVSGWIEFTYFLALGVFSAFTIPAFLYEPTSHDDTLCYVISVVLQFSEIMTYSSYIMIAVDVYWMLRKSDTFAAYGEEIDESKMRLAIYLLILLAVPVGVITYGLLLNQESIPTEASTTVPYYGKKSCFAPKWIPCEYLIFGTESATLLIILLSVNHIFGRISASTDVDDAPRVSLLSNMFFFTLCYWITDLLKFARPLLSKNHESSSDTDTFWIVLDSFTYAQGMLSFIVFIFNRKTLKAFKRKAGGTNGTLRAMFRHACCSDGSRVDAADEDGTPMSPLMKSSSMKRSTVRQNHLY